MGNKKWYQLCADDERDGATENCFQLDISNKTLSSRFVHPRAFELSAEGFGYDMVTQWY